MKGTLHEDQYTFFITSLSVLLRMRNISDKLCRKIQKHIFYIQQVFTKNRAVYEIMWKNSAEPDRFKKAISRIRIAFWIATVTNTNSEYVILLAFPPQH